MDQGILAALRTISVGNVVDREVWSGVTSTETTRAADLAVEQFFHEANTLKGSELLMDLAAAYEDLGFLNGLRFGVQLMTEIFTKTSV